MNQRYMDFVPKNKKLPVKKPVEVRKPVPVAEEPEVMNTKATDETPVEEDVILEDYFAVDDTPRRARAEKSVEYGVIEEYRPKFVRTEIKKRPLGQPDEKFAKSKASASEKYVSGVILFDETARDWADNGETYVNYLISKRIVPGIKVDQGLTPFNNTEENITKGLDGLESRLLEYYMMGLRFAKWRAAFNITENTPTDACIEENCRILSEYAKKCQSAGIVPIVEPEVVYDGYYDINKSAEITSKILDYLFENLIKFGVNLKACILKVNMVLAGKQYEVQSTAEEVGKATAEVLKNHVPKDLAGVVFLSGGQTVEQATDNLAEIIKNGPFPWPVTFSFARALQDPALFTWKGSNENSDAARAAFKDRLIANTEVL